MWTDLIAWLRRLVWLLTPDRVVAIGVETGYRRRTMWTPVDGIDVGRSCSLRVLGTKKSGTVVELTSDQYSATDGAAVEIIGDQVTGREEGVATITAALIANPAITGSCTLAVADPIMTLDVSTGNNVEEDPVENVAVQTGRR